MVDSSVFAPRADDPPGLARRHALMAHETLDTLHKSRLPDQLDPQDLPRGLRAVVRESWQRSLSLATNPDAPHAPLALSGPELEHYRSGHALAAIMPVIQRLLVEPSRESGLLVAVGDAHGRLLWVDGDTSLRRRAETMMFVEGSDWSEAAVGTSAPGTALALGSGIQIAGAEHFNRAVHSLSCTAVPLHDPITGELLGVVDITGGESAVAEHTLTLVKATVAAAQTQLHLLRLQAGTELTLPRTTPERGTGRVRTSPQVRTTARKVPLRTELKTLGTDHPELQVAGKSFRLSQRHGEILLLLSAHPQGLNAEELTTQLYGEEGSTVTLRAEMVRLRKILAAIDPELVPQSRPYRLAAPLDSDLGRVLSQVGRGSHRQALESYVGAALPHSEAPGVVLLREHLSQTLREALLAEGSAEALLQFAALPEAVWDEEVRRTALKLLPARSPKRASVVAELALIEHHLS